MTLLTKSPINCTAEENANIKKRNGWTNLSRVITVSDSTYSSSHFTQKESPSGTSSRNYPWTVSAYNFGIDSSEIPDGAWINRIIFRVRMRVGGGCKALVPTAKFCLFGSSSRTKYDDTKIESTGWNDGVYCVYPSKHLSTNWETYSYVMERDDVNKAKFSNTALRNPAFGVDLCFSEATFNNSVANYTARVDIAWVECIIDYTLPKYGIEYWMGKTLYNTSKSNPALVDRQRFKLNIRASQKTNADGGVQTFKVNLPFGTELESYSVTGGIFHPSNNTWSLKCDGKTTETLSLTLKSFITNISELTVTNDNINKSSFHYKLNRDDILEYDNISVYVDGEPHQNHKMTLHIDIDGISNQDTETYFLSPRSGHIDPISSPWDLNIDASTEGISVYDDSDEGIILNVPVGERYRAVLTYTCYPIDVGEYEFGVSVDSDENQYGSASFTVKAPYVYNFGNDVSDAPNNARINGDIITIQPHKIVTIADTDNVVIPFRVAEDDAIMTQSRSNLHFNKYEEVDYIGCVQLEQTHFNPKSTYKDKLLDSRYKNKRYMGKELASDEDITLNVRLHPKDVPTIQGLIDMDKPIPINTNHKSFEGDPLNHRGYAEIYSIKTEPTNPHWYKCDIDVKYLTHNLNARYKILRGSKIHKYNSQLLFTEIHHSGDRIEDFFTVDTDGTYVYNEDETVDDVTIEVPDNKRNVFGLDSGQHMLIKSKKLEGMSEVSFEWSSVVLSETLENNVRRIVRLKDYFTKETVFEYEYTDYEYEYDSDSDVVEHIQCSPIWRVYEGGDFDSYTEQVDFRMGFDSESSVSDSEEYESLTDAEGDSTFGSTLHFKLINNELEITDEGFNGKEVHRSGIELQQSAYYWETEWINESEEDLECYVDFTVQETIFKSRYSSFYPQSVVSPFPVPEKEITFTREAEEGVIYYMRDDKEEFSYLIDPYYVYQNGCDLVSDSGISIFSLDYDFDTVYIQNGLVRMGFNRLNGQLYLGKYDPKTKSYITTHTFHLNKYSDINVNSITDDKIAIQVSDVVFSIYRGHPYIIVNHRGEHLYCDNKFIGVWGEAVHENATDLPKYWDLMNHSNLLPANIGGVDELKSDATVTVNEVTGRTATNLSWSTLPTLDIDEGDSVTFNLSNCVANKEIVVMLNGEELRRMTPTGTTATFTVKFEEKGNHKIQAFLIGDDNTQMSSTTKLGVRVMSSAVTRLEFVNSGLKKVTYNDKSNISFRLTHNGDPMGNKVVKMETPTGILDGHTTAGGLVHFQNNGYNVGKYKIGASYNDDNNKRVAQTYKWIEIVKGSPTIQVDNWNGTFHKGDNVVIRLAHHTTPLANQRLTIYINGKAYSRKTNEYGVAVFPLNHKGVYKFKIIYKGNGNLNSVNKSYVFQVGD